MPMKSPPALSWCEFKIFINWVHYLAQKPGNKNLYRIIAFAGVIAHCGFHVDEALSIKWKHLGEGVPDGVAEEGGYSHFSTPYGYFEIPISSSLISLAYKAFVTAFPLHIGTFLGKQHPILQQYIAPQVGSNGLKPISHQALNRLLVKVAVDFGYTPDRISAIVFRKTWARHQFDLMGQTSGALGVIKRTLKSKSLAEAMRFIALPHENGVPPIRP